MNAKLLSSVLVGLTLASLLLLVQVGADKLDEQIQQLNDLMDRRPVIRLNPDKFRRFVGSQSIPRNYSMIVMLTALSPQRSCSICRQAYEEFVITANSYRNSPLKDSKRLYFGLVDYDEGSEIFNSLNINTAPCVLFFNEKGNFRNPDELSIQRLGFAADVIGRWVADKTGLSIKIVRPSNMSVPIIIAIFGVMTVAILYLSRNSLGMIFNRNVWAISAVSIVLLMTSGQMWNHIRGAPLMHRGRHESSFIHQSNSGQYVIETYIVMALNAGIGIGIILMTDALRLGSKMDGRNKKLLARVGLFLTVLFYSLLLKVFRQKSAGYPFMLLFG